MTSYKSTLIAAGFAAALTIGGISTASAATNAERANTFRLTGTIVGIDRSARTVTVRKDGTNASVRVHVPEGGTIALSQNAHQLTDASNIQLERAHRGQKVNLEVASGDPSSR